MIGTIAWFQEATLAAVASVIASLSIWLFPAAGPLGATLSNGTHAWSPTVIVLSLDGFKPQYLASSLTPTLASLAANGSWMSRGERHASNNVLAAEYMLPASPSLTFPNHWSIQTGLQPSGHGIIANDFHLAPDEHGRIRPNSSFYYTDPARSWDPKWWKGVSMWEHLERRNIATANLMWPGPPVTEHGTQSTHFQRYEKGWSLQQRHDRVFEWLDLEVSQRPQFICAYAPDVDTVTHSLGPDPRLAPVAAALESVDAFVQGLLQSIADRNASSIINLVVVSDHGMTFTSNERLIYIDHMLGPSLLKDIVTLDGWPNVGMRFTSKRATQHAHSRLIHERDAWRALGIDAFDVVERDELLARFNWTTTELARDRAGDLWVLPSVGWSVTTHDEMKSFGLDYAPRGNHGYDANHPDMHAFFLATGPSVRPRKEPRMPAFRNVEVHNLAMAMLGVDAAKNDGTPGFWSPLIESP